MIPDKDKFMLMATTATVKQITKVIQDRMILRNKTIDLLSNAPLSDLPESILKGREEEAAKNRAIVQEQGELLSIIQALFPDA